MDTTTALALFEAMHRGRHTFGYSGRFKDDHTAKLIALGEGALTEEQAAVRGKLAFVMVESYQNIIRHRLAVPSGAEEARSLFFLRGLGKGQQVVTVNPLAAGNAAALTAQLEQLAPLDHDQLKQLFLRGLQRAQDPERRGAGLGLIEMARRSGTALGHRVKHLGEGLELVALAVRLGETPPLDQVLDEVMGLHGTVVEERIVFLHVGPRSVQLVAAIMQLLQAEDEDTGARAARPTLAALDALDLFGGPEAPGLVVVSGDPGDGRLSAGVLTTAADARRVGEALAVVRAWSASELQQHYRDALRGRDGTGIPLALIELVMATGGSLELMEQSVDGGVFALFRARL